MLPLFFLIYINRVFNKVSEISLLVIFLAFINNLGLIVLGSFIEKVVKTLTNIAQIVLG